MGEDRDSSPEVRYLFIRSPKVRKCRSKTRTERPARNSKRHKPDESYTFTRDELIQQYNEDYSTTRNNWNDSYITPNSDGFYTHSVSEQRRHGRDQSEKRETYKLFHSTKKNIIIKVYSSNLKLNSRLTKSTSEPTVKSSGSSSYNEHQRYSAKVKQYSKLRPHDRNFIVNNCCRTCDKPQCKNPFINPAILSGIYRCQISSHDEACCCSCNSEAMFEVMKSLYDCYKKRNCTNCKCILCGSLPLGARGAIGEQKKSVAVGVGEGLLKEKMAKAKAAGLLTPLTGKTPEQKEKILRGLVAARLPLPEGKTPSEKKLIDKIRKEFGLPPEPQSAAEKEKMDKAYADGIITPLEGKTPAQKEAALRKMAAAGIPLPEGRTPSEKALIEKVKASAPAKTQSERLKRAKAAGLLTPLTGKTLQQKEKILKGLIDAGLPLPEGKTPSEKKLIEKLRKDMGLPPEPKSAASRAKLDKAYADGIVTPLEGKTPAQKEAALRKLAAAGIPLPEGRTPSEKALLDSIKTGAPRGIPSDKLRKAKAAGLLTPLTGKTPEQKEKILRGLVAARLPLPEGKTPSEKKLIDKIRKEFGLPPEPKSAAEKEKMDKAYADGIITPLEGKTPVQKEAALRKMVAAGIPLPEGRTPSEKALIEKVKASAPAKTQSERLRRAKAAGLLTPLTGKTPQQKEKILKGLVDAGLPLPEGKTPSEKKLIEKLRKDMGLPPEPKSAASRAKLDKAYADGIVTPLEGKTPAQKEAALRKLAAAGIPLPEGRTSSEKALIEKVKVSGPAKTQSERLRRAKAAGLLTPLTGKTPQQKEKILKGLVDAGLPLPEGKTPSEKKLIEKLRKDMGLPPEPKSAASRAKLDKAYADGIVTPLEGKTPAQKEAALRKLAAAGIPLPEGRTSSEKALIEKVKVSGPAKTQSERLRRAKAAGLLTPLTGKTPQQKEKILKGLVDAGLPLPEGKTPSEKKLIEKLRKDMGLPPEPKSAASRAKLDKAYADGIVTPLEGKTPAQKEAALRKLAAAGIPLPEGRTTSEKALIDSIKTGAPRGIPSDKLRKAKAAGLLTPLTGKTPEQKEKILRGLAAARLPLPEGMTPSEKNLINQIRKELGLPPEPKSAAEKEKMDKAYADGIITPLEGKTPAQKEAALRKMAAAGIPLPEGRTPSEKALIDSIKAGAPRVTITPSEKLRKAKAAGLLTPLTGKTPEQKEKILRGLIDARLPLPEGKTASEKKLIDKIRKEVGLPPEPKSAAEKEKMDKAWMDGIITPLEGKTPAQKEKALRRMAEAGINLPEGRTESEKALIEKIMAEVKAKPSMARPIGGRPALPPDKRQKLDEATAKVVKEGKGPVDECICDLLTPESDRRVSKVSKPSVAVRPSIAISPEKLKAAKAAGLLTPLQGKTPAQKERILRGLAQHGIPFPEPKTESEKNLMDKIRAEMGKPSASVVKMPSEKIRQAKAAGLLTPLTGKSPEEKERILRGLAQAGFPLPEGKTPSEKQLIAKVRKEMGLPPEPKNAADRQKLARAHAAGIVSPLEGKTPEQKEEALRKMAEAGIPLPEGRTPSEKALINKIKKEVKPLPSGLRGMPSEKLKAAKAAGLLTPLDGKTPEQKERILRGLAEHGIPFPESKTESERKLMDKIRADTSVIKIPSEKLRRAKAEGLLTPLTGKSPEEKERILKGLAKAGLPLPEGKTPSEKKLIAKVRNEMGLPPEPKNAAERHKLAKAHIAGIVTPLEGKTPEQKEKALRKMAEAGIPLPEGRTKSEKDLIDKIKKEVKPLPSVLLGVPSEKIRKARAEGLLTPLEGKTPEQKENILRGLAQLEIPLPEGKTASDKKLIDKVKADFGLLPRRSTAAEKEMTRKSPSEKIRQARAAGLLTTLDGKTPEQKEKILRGLAQAGLPLPEPKTASERNLIDKVRRDLGLPPEPRTPAEREKLEKAIADGIVTPLEGKDNDQKEKILKKMAEAGIPLPEGRTNSEKALIAKMKQETGAPSVISSGKIRKAKAAGLLTSLDGKTPEQKEKILRGLAEAKLPLPEGKTPSEKALVNKIRTEYGIPPEGTTPSEKEIIKKAKAEGLFTPLAGKTSEQKERIIKGLIDAGLPVPEGETASEKDLIKRLRQEAGLPAEPTPSERRGKIRKKSKRIGPGAKLSKTKGVGEEIEEIVKTTKCDQACGCDKKKIRFKHSYVKIRVTSPDFSSLCDCPNECLPGVKGGVMADDEGIKVTVGRVIGIPSYSQSLSSSKTHPSESPSDHADYIYTEDLKNRSAVRWKSFNDLFLSKSFFSSHYRGSSYYYGVKSDFSDDSFASPRISSTNTSINDKSRDNLSSKMHSYANLVSREHCINSEALNFDKSYCSLPSKIKLMNESHGDESLTVILETDSVVSTSSGIYDSYSDFGTLSIISVDTSTNTRSSYEYQDIDSDNFCTFDAANVVSRYGNLHPTNIYNLLCDSKGFWDSKYSKKKICSGKEFNVIKDVLLQKASHDKSSVMLSTDETGSKSTPELFIKQPNYINESSNRQIFSKCKTKLNRSLKRNIERLKKLKHNIKIALSREETHGVVNKHSLLLGFNSTQASSPCSEKHRIIDELQKNEIDKFVESENHSISRGLFSIRCKDDRPCCCQVMRSMVRSTPSTGRIPTGSNHALHPLGSPHSCHCLDSNGTELISTEGVMDENTQYKKRLTTKKEKNIQNSNKGRYNKDLRQQHHKIPQVSGAGVIVHPKVNQKFSKLNRKEVFDYKSYVEKDLLQKANSENSHKECGQMNDEYMDNLVRMRYSIQSMCRKVQILKDTLIGAKGWACAGHKRDEEINRAIKIEGRISLGLGHAPVLYSTATSKSVWTSKCDLKPHSHSSASTMYLAFSDFE